VEYFNWELFDHPPYSPVLALSDYHLFTYLKNCLGSQHFNSNEELMEGVKMWLSPKAADFFDTGIQNLFPDTGASVPLVTTLRSSFKYVLSFCI
jgi:histone-lysine N-methyltransferase SETMAR